MADRIVIDPVTRIEGHLRIEAQVEGGKVAKAFSSGTMFRGMELILQGRDPREAWIWAQRICGVCTTVHAHASVYAVEDALGVEIPPNARLIRNLIAGTQHIQDHVIHFYHLHALDWVDVTGALVADPAKTAALAQSISDWPNSSVTYFAGVQARVKKLVDSGQLSLFASGYWGHPAYKLPPEANLMAVAHYLEALEWQRDVIRVHAVLGGKNPHPQTYLVGGMAAAVDPNSPNVINWERITFMQERIKAMRGFVEKVYVPDVKAVASFYPEWWELGAGHKNYLSYGGLQQGNRADEASFGFNRGIIVGGDLSKIVPLDQQKITEAIAHSFYEYGAGDAAALHPWAGETKPKYTGPTPPFEMLDVEQKYSWLKSPRYDGLPMEVGPLARMLVAYGAGNQRVQELVNGALTELKLQPAALFSTLGRVAARALETVYLLDLMDAWIGELAANMESGDLRIHDGSKWDPSTWPAEAEGWGFHEAPRGALGHWIKIKDKKIANYQAVVPSTWNAGPRDEKGVPGPYEAALEGTPVADPEQPLELLRTIHSFDPCLACAVHVVDANGKERVRVEVR
ncbi:MAG TPA: nickel-dependent hydrogenase large subunit [Candidatus Limnocylindrales bacterium]|nr:nickel-dependent hydrogenase large subunit [Candidatus Limnocylindrales bacterium]